MVHHELAAEGDLPTPRPDPRSRRGRRRPEDPLGAHGPQQAPSHQDEPVRPAAGFPAGSQPVGQADGQDRHGGAGPRPAPAVPGVQPARPVDGAHPDHQPGWRPDRQAGPAGRPGGVAVEQVADPHHVQLGVGGQGQQVALGAVDQGRPEAPFLQILHQAEEPIQQPQGQPWPGRGGQVGVKPLHPDPGQGGRFRQDARHRLRRQAAPAEAHVDLQVHRYRPVARRLGAPGQGGQGGRIVDGGRQPFPQPVVEQRLLGRLEDQDRRRDAGMAQPQGGFQGRRAQGVGAGGRQGAGRHLRPDPVPVALDDGQDPGSGLEEATDGGQVGVQHVQVDLDPRPGQGGGQFGRPGHRGIGGERVVAVAAGTGGVTRRVPVGAGLRMVFHRQRPFLLRPCPPRPVGSARAGRSIRLAPAAPPRGGSGSASEPPRFLRGCSRGALRPGPSFQVRVRCVLRGRRRGLLSFPFIKRLPAGPPFHAGAAPRPAGRAPLWGRPRPGRDGRL